MHENKNANILDQISNKWYSILSVIGILQVIILILSASLMAGIIANFSTDVTPYKIILYLPFGTLAFMPFLAVLVLINIIGAPIYIAREKPRGKRLAFLLLSLLLSVALALYWVVFLLIQK